MVEIILHFSSIEFERIPYLCPYCRRPNYLSEEFYDNCLEHEYTCCFCKRTYSKLLLIKNVEYDADTPYDWVIKINFTHSKSKFYNKAKNIAKLLPNFINNNNGIFCGTKQIEEYCKYSRYFEELCELVVKWKGTQIFYFDRLRKYKIDFDIFVKRVRSLAGEYNILLDRYYGEEVTFENLPLPYVYYPSTGRAFFAFSDTPHSDIYFCDCEREAIENYIKILKIAPIKNNTSHQFEYFPKVIANKIRDSGQIDIKYKPKLCFKCNKIVPALKYCHPMYGGEFEQKYGWYIIQEYLKNGILPNHMELGAILQDKCAEYLKNSVELEKSLRALTKADPKYEEISTKLEQAGRVCDLLNDKVRTDFGYRGIGEHWVNETTLKHIIESLFPEKTVLTHYRPKWLDGLELDIYLPEIQLGFEYQGIQHFQAVKHWGGKQKLIIQQEHDSRKKSICEKLGITLVYFDYTENITTEYVKAKIKEFL